MLFANCNAAGDHMKKTGSLWLAYPHPNAEPRYVPTALPIELEGTAAGFRFNSDHFAIRGTTRPWLYTSGLLGAEHLTIRLSDGETHSYAVALHFAEIENLGPGQRVFDVKVQGKSVLTRLDIVQQAGAPRQALVKRLEPVRARGTLTIDPVPVAGREPILCAIEIKGL